MPDQPKEITALLARVREGQQSALDELIPLVYHELHRLARAELRRDRSGHTLQPTALINEAFLRLFGDKPPTFSGRAHFIGVAARVMRQVLVDYARNRRAQKRGAGLQTPLFDHSGAASPVGDLLEVDEALNKLSAEDSRLVILIEMRFFAGMTAEEIAEARSESVHLVRHDLRYARARLRFMLNEGGSSH